MLLPFKFHMTPVAEKVASFATIECHMASETAGVFVKLIAVWAPNEAITCKTK